MGKIFDISPPPATSMWPLLLIPLVIAAGLFFLVAAGHLSCELAPEGLRLRAPLYGRLVPWREVDSGSARATDFASEPGLRPTRRTNGIGMPGYQVGWFRLQNGSRALVLRTAAERVVVVQTHAGYVIIVGVDDAEGLVSALRARQSLGQAS